MERISTQISESGSMGGDCRLHWVSGNYNYKMGVGQLRRLDESPYKRQYRSMSFARRDMA